MGNVLEWVGPPAPQLLSVPTPGRGPRPYPVSEIDRLSWVEPHAFGYYHHAKMGFMLWLFGAAIVAAAVVRWYTRAGREKLKTRQVRGQVVVRAMQLVQEISEFNAATAKAKNRPDHLPARLVGVPYPFDAELEHTLITGSPGSGKSVAMHKLLRSIRDRGDKAVIYDPELEYIEQHYNPETDLILNPFDERSPSWSPFYDATDHVEWDRLAHGLFKDPKSGDPYWATHADTLRPLLAFWSEISVSALLSRNAEGIHPHPTWLVFDEYPSLGRIDKLADGPQRLRKYGGAMVLGMQQVSQIQDIYGKEKARTIMGQCLNKLILRCSDNETAQLMSETLGERVMHRVAENTTYGANSIRDGVGLAAREEKEPVYLPTELMNLPSLQGVIRVSNKRVERPFPIAPVSFVPDEKKIVAPAFVKRTGADPVREFIAKARGEWRDPEEEAPDAPTASSGGPRLTLVASNPGSDAAGEEVETDTDLNAETAGN